MIKKMHEVLSIHSPAKKLKISATKPGSITFTKTDLERVQHSHSDPLVIQLGMNNYDVNRGFLPELVIQHGRGKEKD